MHAQCKLPLPAHPMGVPGSCFILKPEWHGEPYCAIAMLPETQVSHSWPRVLCLVSKLLEGPVFRVKGSRLGEGPTCMQDASGMLKVHVYSQVLAIVLGNSNVGTNSGLFFPQGVAGSNSMFTSVS